MHRSECTCPRCHSGRRARKIGLGIGIPAVAVIALFFLAPGVFSQFTNPSNVLSQQEQPSIPPPTENQLEDTRQEWREIIQESPSITTTTPNQQTEQSVLDIAKIEHRVHELVNDQRVSHGLTSLAWDNDLSDVARGHSADMAANSFFEHENLNGQDPTDRAEAAGYDCYKDFGDYYVTGIAENIFQGWTYASYTQIGASITYDWVTEEELAQSAVTGWMNSPGHRENILTETYDREGIGLSIADDGKVYVTQNFC